MRETGWSPICCRRCCLRGVFSSKKLLLCEVIRIENSANNGEIFINYSA